MKHLKLLLCFSFIFHLANAQNPFINWEHIAGDQTAIDRITTTGNDAAGNLYVGGYFYGSIDLDFGPGQAFLTSAGQYDGFVAKYNPFGEFMWARRIGGTTGDQVNNIFVDNSGNMLVTGFFLGTTTIATNGGSYSLTSAGGADAFIASYDTDGALIRHFKVGASGDESGLSIKIDATGSIYLGGTIGSANVNFNVWGGTNTVSSSGSLDGFVAKYINDFTIQWVKGIGGGVGINDAVYDMDIDALGNVYAVGEFRGAASFGNGVTLGTGGGADGFITKINGGGTTLWAKRIGSSGYDVINTIKLNKTGSIFIGGDFSGTVNLNPNGTTQNFTALGGTDIFVAKLDTNLATSTWIKQLGGTGADLIYGLDLDTNNNVYTTGQFDGTVEMPVGTTTSSLTSAGGLDIFVSKLNASGAYVWSQRKGTTGDDLGWSVSASENGNIIYTGGTQGGNAHITKYGECNEVGVITGSVSICNTSTKTYTVTAVSGATSYLWTLPSGWTGTSTTNSITVTPSATSGLISVAAVTSCGTGTARKLQVNYGTYAIDNNLARLWLANASDNNKDQRNGALLTLNNAIKDTDRFGTSNAACRITTTAGFLSTGTNLPTGNTSIAFWYYFEKSAGGNNVLIGSNSTTLPAGHPLLLTDNNAETLHPWSGAGASIGSGIAFAANNWHHIVLTRNGANFTLYLNGVSVATGNTLATSNFDRIGNNRPGFSQGATGKFDDIRIYSSIVTADVVKNIYDFGSVKKLEFNNATCLGNTTLWSVDFSHPAASYNWKINTNNVAPTTPSFSKVIVPADSLVSVTVDNNCVTETYSKKFMVSQRDSIRDTITSCAGYVFGNDTLFVTGNYVDTFANVSGCDSVVYLRLIIDKSTATDLSANLIRYWTMNQQDSLRDVVSGQLLQAPVSRQDTVDRNGNNGASIHLSGSAFVPQTPLPATDVTVSFWYNPVDVSGIQKVLLSSGTTQARSKYLFMQNGQFHITNNGNSINSTTTIFAANKWYHVTFTLYGSGLSQLYINGVLQLSHTGMYTGGIINIGNSANGFDPALGRFDDIKIHNRVFTPNEVASLYQMPSLLAFTREYTACETQAKTVSFRTSANKASAFAILKNDTVVASDTSVTFNSIQLRDSIVHFRVYTECAYETYQSKFNVIPSRISIIDTSCTTVTYNNKTYNNSGVYYDTVANTGCNTIVTLNLAIGSQYATNLSNGLIHYWTLNASDNKRDLATNQANAFTTAATNTNGRTGLINGGLNIAGVGATQAIIAANTLPASNLTISFWYQRTTSAYTGARTLIGNNQSNGNIAKYLYVNNLGQLYCGTNTTNAGVNANFTLTAGVWYHITYQISAAGVVDVFVNGSLTLTTGAPTHPITRIGNRTDGNEPGVGNFEDIKIYDRLITAAEVDVLSKEVSLLQMPSAIQACEGANVRFTFAVSKDSTTSIQIFKGNALLASDTTAMLNGITPADSLITLRITKNCFTQNIIHRITVAPTTAAPTLLYNGSTKRISATSAFNKYVLFRNGVAIDSSLTSGNINYLSTLCGSYYAQFSNTGIPCPSTSNTILIANDTTKVSATLCSGKTRTFGNQQIQLAGAYFHTFIATTSCDSIVQLTVNMLQATSSTITRSSCGSLVLNGKTYTQSGSYKDTLVNANGCDSVISLNLTINTGGPSVNNITINTCNSFTLNGKTYSQTGIYRDTIFGGSAVGCDSILVLNLTLGKNASTRSVVACKQYVFNGKTYTQSGIYYDTLTNIAGCDSIVTFGLTINRINTLVTKAGTKLSVAETNAQYQWIDCATMLPINGATAQTFTPLSTGSYKVVAYTMYCIDTSVCTDMVVVTCNADVQATKISNANRCEQQIKVTASSVSLPLKLNISWAANTIGNDITITDTFYTCTELCPNTYKIKVTDNNGCTDSVNVVVDEPVGLNNWLMENQVKLYPNPVNDVLFIEKTMGSPLTVIITDVQGRTCKTITSEMAQTMIDVKELTPGVYLIRLEQDGNTLIKRLIKQ